MVCKTLFFVLFVFALAPTRAIRRKSFALAIGKRTDDYLPVCANSIVKETCDMLIGGLKKGESDELRGYLRIDSIQELLAANEESMVGLLKSLGFPTSKMPTKEQLASISEESKKILQHYGMKIAKNKEGEHLLTVACENLCDVVKKYVEEKYVLPPSSDIMAITTSGGNLEWTIDVRPETLNNLWKGGEMPKFEESNSKSVYTAVNASSPPGNVTATRQPQGPSTLKYTKWAIVEAVAQLFRFYPVQEVSKAASVLQTSVAYEVAQGKLQSSVVWDPDEAVRVGRRSIGYVRQVQRQLELPGTLPKIKHWFGVADSATKAEVARVMSSVISILNNVHYHYKGPSCEANTFAYVYPNGMEGCSNTGSNGPGDVQYCKTNAQGQYIYYLCDLYVTTDEGEKIETLVHEGSHHEDARTDDVCSDHYYDKDTDICQGKAYGRDTCAQMAKIEPARALKNADNHCYFVQAVADPAYKRGMRCAQGSRALSWFADSDGDCQCPSDGPCYKGSTRNCPSSAGQVSKYFSASCKDCKCRTPAPKTTCPSFAESPTPDSDGDCRCPAKKDCKDGEHRCPSFSRGISAHYFRSTCTTCTCEDRPQFLLLVAGNVVKVETEFESISQSRTTITVGLMGKVDSIDSDGDASILYDGLGKLWVLKDDFGNMKKFEFYVGAKVKVKKVFSSISGKQVSAGKIGTIKKIDEESDASISFEGIGNQWVSWKHFDKLIQLDPEGKCPGGNSPDDRGDCRCPANSKCKKKNGGQCLTTDGSTSLFLFAASCTDCQCIGDGGKPVVPPNPTPGGNSTDDGSIDDKPSDDDDKDNGSSRACQSICVVLVSMFASMFLQ